MKVVILAGGFGTRLSEETHLKPKPMVEIGGKPILWHIMKTYAHYGYTDFIVCLGYKGYIIKEYFANYFIHQSDLTINLKDNTVNILNSKAEPWNVTLIDTGANTMTGGRIKRIKSYLTKPFMLTYGDGLSNVDIHLLVDQHQKSNALLTVTAVQPSGRFGALDIRDNVVHSFLEKPKGDGSWINGGFFVCQPEVIEYIEDDQTIWERTPLENIARDEKLMAYEHVDFWQPMDTLRDKRELERLWNTGEAPWKVW